MNPVLLLTAAPQNSCSECNDLKFWKLYFSIYLNLLESLNLLQLGRF